MLYEVITSILDWISDDIERMRRRLGPNDYARLDRYLENVREIERRIRNAATNPAADVDADVPFGIPERKDAHFKIMYDLVGLAFQA